MTIRDACVVTVSSVVVVAAILGGAFYPGPRIVVGMLLAVTLGWAIAVMRGRLTAEEWMAFGFVVWGVVSAAVAATAPLAARETVVVWIVACGLWLVARRAAENGSQAALIVVAAGGVIVALGVMCETLGMGGIRVGGLLENPNVAASLLVVSLPVLVIIGGRRRWPLAAGVVMVLGLILTGSRAGLLALLASAAVVLPRGRPRFFGLLTGSLGVTAVLVWRFANQPDVLAWFRPAIWSAVVRLWAAHPLLGVGPGGLVDAAGVQRLLHADHVGQRQFLISYAESSPLALLVQTGLIGFVIAAAAIFVWWRRAHQSQRLSRPLGVVLAAMAVMGLFHDLLTMDVVLWWWALSFGLMEARGAPIPPKNYLSDYSKGRRVFVALVFAFIVLWGVVQPAWARWLWRSGTPGEVLVARSMRAEPWFDAPLEWRVRDLLRRESWSWETAAEAICRGRRAVQIHPGAAGLWSILGMVHARVVTDFGPWPDSVDGARSAFARAVALEPHQPWAWLEWARLERNLGQTSDAVNLVRRALEAEPHTVRARLFLARLELDLGNSEAAREAYFSALQSTRLHHRANLSAYERELLGAPKWQFREIGEALR
jgi:cytochrome c-type biogenesis protein CcmH/NrfG